MVNVKIPKAPTLKLTKKENDNSKSTTIFVEIGPNLREVLFSMVNKVYNCSNDPIYYKIAFEPIYKIIKRLVDQRDNGQQGELE